MSVVGGCARTVVCGVALVGARGQDGGTTGESEVRFAYPCEKYREGLRGEGNFGVLVEAKGTPFHGTWHLAEDVWLPAGTEVRAVADGVVKYSAFSPTWTDERGGVHWNLGNVIVIEHELRSRAEAAEGRDEAEGAGRATGEEEPADDLRHVCSIYVHLAADRTVALGDRVTRGQAIGRIGKDRSEENGRYPAHLHFGLHRGPYFQIPPVLERELRRAAASEAGLRFGETVLRGEIELRRRGESDVWITAREDGGTALFSLLVGSTAPVDPPPDIMSWCKGYGDRETVGEWLRPSTFLRGRGAE